MASILDSITNLFQHQIPQGINSATQYFNPESNGGNNFWSSPIAQNLGKAQQITQPVAQPLLDTIGQGTQAVPRLQQAVYNTSPLLFHALNGFNTQAPGVQLPQNYKPLTDVGNVAKATLAGAGSIAAPGAVLASGLISGGFGAANNLINRQPVLNNINKSVGEGLNFGAITGPIGELAGQLPTVEKVGTPIAAKLKAVVGDKAANVIGSAAANATKEFATGAGYGAATGQNPLQTGASFAPYGLIGGGKLTGAIDKNSQELQLGLKGVNPEAFNLHPEDAQIMNDFIVAVRNPKEQAMTPAISKGAQVITENLLPGYKISSNEKLANAFEYILNSNEKTHMPGDTMPRPDYGYKSMGLVTNPSAEQIVKPPTESIVSKTQEPAAPEVTNPIDPFYNVKRVGIDQGKQQELKTTIENAKPQIEDIVGKKMSHQEVIDFAKNTSNVLNKTIGRDQTLEMGAANLNLRNEIAQMAKTGTVTPEFIDALTKDKAMGENMARLLGQRSITSSPQDRPAMQAVLEAVLKKNSNTDEILKAAQGVDFNDANQAANFYRQFVKPKLGNYLDTIRYNSMLSSPNTHINNFFSNAVNTGVIAPVEKTLTGVVDYLGSKITGKEQGQFAGEGAAYTKGYYSNLSSAAHKFADTVRGVSANTNLDITKSDPLHGTLFDKAFSLPTRLLEASDQFFTELTKGGEMAALNYRANKGVVVNGIEKQATNNAAYRLYRGDLHPKGQGTILNSIDDITAKIQDLRASENPVTSTIAKFTLPFVKTPMNILKQGVEYSPVGVLTLPGAANKSEQISKAIIGSTAMAGTMMLVTSGRTTWAEPTDPTKLAEFRAAGLQPYSIKIGDNWISYSKLPPAFSFPMAFVSALYDAQQNKTINQSNLDAILTAASKYGNFFADQSYLKNIGDALAAVKGNPSSFGKFVSNYPQQLVPYRALLGWMARITDPNQRKVDNTASFWDQQVQQLFTQIPGLSQTVPARLDSNGNPVINQNKEVNAFSPLRVTTENPQAKAIYDAAIQKSLDTKNKNISMKASGGTKVTGTKGRSGLRVKQSKGYKIKSTKTPRLGLKIKQPKSVGIKPIKMKKAA